MAENKDFTDAFMEGIGSTYGATPAPAISEENAYNPPKNADEAIQQSGFEKVIRDNLGLAFPPLALFNAADSILTSQVNAAKEARKYDPTAATPPSKTAIKDAASDATGVVTPEEIMKKLVGFPNISPEFISETLSRTIKTYESPDIEIDITNATPENLNRAINMLGTEKDVNRKILAALAVQAIASQMEARNMSTYMQTARTSLGMDNLDEQIALAIQADIRSPFNPGDGSHSQETQILIDKRASLAQSLPTLARQYAAMDPAIAGPLAASEAILKTLPVAERLEIARETRTQKNAAINTITDTEAKNYAAMTGQFGKIDWNSPGQIFQAKSAFFADKEFQKLSQSGVLSIDDPMVARNLWATAATPTEKNKSFAILQRMEADALGVNTPGISQAERARRLSKYEENVNLLKAAYNAPLSKVQEQAIQDDANRDISGTAKEKDQRRRVSETNYRESNLQSILINRFVSDVTQWKGIDTTDPLATAAIDQIRKSTGKSNVDLQSFISTYLNLPSAIPYQQKLKRIQAYIYSSSNAANDSAILPQISGEQIYNKAAPGAARIWLNTILHGGVRG